MARLTTSIAFATTILSTTLATQFVMYTPGGDEQVHTLPTSACHSFANSLSSTVIERIDPIINPGTISGHVHQVFGANGLSPNMTYDSLQQSDCTTVGSADHGGNAADKSVYWIPSLYMDASDGTGYVRVPTNGHKMYYRDVGDDSDKKREPFEFPHGFRMVAGDMSMRAAATDTASQEITQWTCHNSENGGDVNGEEGGFPKGVSDCQTYPYLAGTIHFPHCWNGDDFDQENPTAHVAYPDGDIQAGKCPSSHPIRLPHIFQEHFFDLHSVVNKVKPNTFVLAQGDNTGFGLHADFFSGWDDGAIPELFSSCPSPYYGNEDIGTCPSFKKFSATTDSCKLSVTYKENVDSPGNALPGCNPISDINPAPKLAVAALGQSINDCAAAAAAESPSGNVASSGASNEDAGSSSAAAFQAPLPTTLVTSATAAAVTAATATANDVVWVTQIVTVFARDAEATPVPRSRRSRIMRE